ncbi:MAG: SDR family oxidoreductase [Planctomycetes bacterium]|nr:SDR family oxidoreductase [Planctomycetota bacterium]
MSEQRVVLITGAGSGIGRASALRFAREGWRVVAIGRRREKVEETAAAIAADAQARAAGGGCQTAALDVAEAGAMAALADSVVEARGRLDALVANAGIAYARHAALETSDEDWDETLRINLTGVHRSCTAVLPHMVAAGAGAIVTIASIAGQVGMAQRGSYGTSKAGVIGYTRNLAVDYAPHGVRANAVCPGFIVTDINRHSLTALGERGLAELVAKHPLGLGEPEDAAAAIWFLCSDDSRWITGVDLSVDGGYTAW